MSDAAPSKERRSLPVWVLIVLILLLALGLPVTAILVVRHPHIIKRRSAGAAEVRLVESKGRHQLLVDGEPFIIRGVCYNPVPAGKGFDYDFWGKNSPALGIDGALMEKSNINTVRFYKAGKNPDDVRMVINGLYKDHGIFTLLGHHLGFWEWPPPEYADPQFREKIESEVLAMVREYKNEPGILGWILGNENNYSFDLNVRSWTSDAIEALPTDEDKRRERARIYYSWVNDMARRIKKIDPRHPVVMGVGETKSLEWAAQFAPDIDILGLIAYRGPSFGNLFREVKQKMDKPVMLIEFGADRFNALTQLEEENYQAEFIKSQWREILKNSAAVGGARNCVGGTLFEWTDEWWKGSDVASSTWAIQDGAAHWRNPAYYFDADKDGVNNMNEEWWGIVKINPNRKEHGFDGRIPTKACRLLETLWAADKP